MPGCGTLGKSQDRDLPKGINSINAGLLLYVLVEKVPRTAHSWSIGILVQKYPGSTPAL